MSFRLPPALVALAAAVASVAAAGCAGRPVRPDAFYAPPALAPGGRPGDLVRMEPLDDGPAGARSWRILYRSTGMKGEPEAVSALLVVPDAPAPAGGRGVVAWAHPTTGVVQDCAPSLQPGWRKTIPGLDRMLEAGLVVVATDYPGLGAPGQHPYLVGASEARAVVDSVRAARNVKEAAAGGRFAVWGHSQGGHAAVFTGQLAARLAPDLTLVGVAAAAPATDLGALLELDLGTRFGNVLASETLVSWNRVLGAPLASVLKPEMEPVVDRVARHCIRDPIEVAGAFSEALPLREGFLTGHVSATPPWSEIVRENTPGADPIRVPVFVSQGTVDEIVAREVTARWAGALCAQGTPVRWVSVPDEGHFFVAFKSAPDAVDWMVDRLAGKPAPDDCVRGAR